MYVPQEVSDKKAKLTDFLFELYKKMFDAQRFCVSTSSSVIGNEVNVKEEGQHFEKTLTGNESEPAEMDFELITSDEETI